MRLRQRASLFLAPLLAAAPVLAQEGGEATFDDVATRVHEQLEDSIQELNTLRAQMEEELVPMSQELSGLEAQLSELRAEANEARRDRDNRVLEVSNLRREIETAKQSTLRLSNLLSEYVRYFDSRLHVVERQRYADTLSAAQLAPENSSLSDVEVFQVQTELLSTSIDRLEDGLGGTRFDGTAVDSTGLVKQGTILLVGPVAFFRSADGTVVGTAEERLNSAEPTINEFVDPLLTEAAGQTLANSSGLLPIDTTLGNAHKIAAVEETFIEHVKKGGNVMWPIFIMAGIALLVALYKWVRLSMVRMPSKRRVEALLEAAGSGDQDAAESAASEVKGPVGEMLRAGVEHMQEPRELVEEVMYEKVLQTRLKLNSALPFIAICAASAPLLGLLGTVTGIINTFKLITVFGSGDVKMLSGGISEALITTKFGLIVAIPSLLIHAFLSRKARGVVGRMETAAVAFVNRLGAAGFDARVEATPVLAPAQAAPPVAAARTAPIAAPASDPNQLAGNLAALQAAAGQPQASPEQLRELLNGLLNGLEEQQQSSQATPTV